MDKFLFDHRNNRCAVKSRYLKSEGTRENSIYKIFWLHKVWDSEGRKQQLWVIGYIGPVLGSKRKLFVSTWQSVWFTKIIAV